MLQVHHSSRVSGTVESLQINLLLTRLMNEAKFLKGILYFSKYQNFSGGNFSLMLSIVVNVGNNQEMTTRKKFPLQKPRWEKTN